MIIIKIIEVIIESMYMWEMCVIKFLIGFSIVSIIGENSMNLMLVNYSVIVKI